MSPRLTLPEPDVAEQEHSNRLTRLIQVRIAENGGFLSFREYMELVLYAPGLGYYAAGLQKFGASGDFVTAPELSPLFARCFAEQCREVLAGLSSAAVVWEIGGGSGRLAVDLLRALEALDALPARYLILELSAELRDRQQRLLRREVPELAARVEWLDRWPAVPLEAVVIGNEVLDAMSVNVFVEDAAGTHEMGVALDDSGALMLATRQAAPAFETTVEGLMAEGAGERQLPYRSEWNPNLVGWFAGLSESLSAGAVLLVDYGYVRKDYYHAQRTTGTLMCYFRHRAVDDPLRWPGLQDLTASVDFTAVAEAGVASGLDFAGYTSQAWFLIANGLQHIFEAACERAPADAMRHSHALKMMTLPSEMGERFQVIGFSKRLESPLRGFALHHFNNKL